MKRQYHHYVFDVKKRKFVGKFEQMYAHEDREAYDSWYQEDLMGLKYILSKAILDQYNFESVLDIGCGKGAFTHLLKKKNNKVLGVDISETAVKKAKVKFPDIDFKVLKAEQIVSLKKKFDIVIIMEVLSYLKHWKEVIRKIATATDYIFISLYIPPNPIGYVKSFTQLSREVEKFFAIVTKIHDVSGREMLILGRKKTR